MIILGNNGDFIIVADGQTVIDNSIDIFSPVSGSLTVFADYRDVIFNLLGGTNADGSLSNVTISLNTNYINLGSGNKVVYGNVRDINMSILGGVASDGNEHFNVIENNLIDMEGNIITGANGSNLVYGNLRDLTLTVCNAFASNGSFLGNQIDGNTFNLGHNNITLGNGFNTVFGVMHDLTLNITGGVATDNGLSDSAIGPSYFGDPNNFNLQSNNITVGNGNNIIYGDLETLEVLIQAGSVSGTSPDFPVSDNEVFSNEIVMSGNIIKAGFGNNVVHGNMGDLLSTVSGGELDGSLGYPFNAFYGNDVILGANQIAVGNGNNIIFGNMHDLVLVGIGGFGQNISLTDRLHIFENLPSELNNYSMGGNLITAGTGHNEIYGTLHDMVFDISGGHNTSSPANTWISAAVILNSFDMGNNIITVGGGGNLIYGDLHDMNLTCVGGDSTDGLRAINIIRNDAYSLGSNTLTSGSGADILYGSLHDLNIYAQGGTADGHGSPGLSAIRSETIHISTNTIQAGSGSDILYGDMHSLSLAVKGGTVTNGGILVTNGAANLTDASAHLLNLNLTMAGNTISGGDGNDVLFGNVEDLSFSATNGTVDGNIAARIPGVGDAGAYFSGGFFLTNGVVVPDGGNHITFGNDVISGGAGNDFLCGDALNLTDLDVFLNLPGPVGEASKNTVKWGNDILTGGSGADNFAFSLVDDNNNVLLRDGVIDGMQGDDTILDFSKTAGDKLDFFGINNLAALDAATDYVNVDATHDRIDFHGGGSIVLTGAGMGAINDLAGLAAGGTIVFNQLV